MNPYHHFVSEFTRIVGEARSQPLGQFSPCPCPAPAPAAPKALIFSPHPDDEVIIGGLALRLLRQSGWNIINVAVTQGSNRERQAERLAELRACCDCIGFVLLQTAPRGLEKVNLETRRQQPALWAQSVKVIASTLSQHRPGAIFVPHADDWNSTHIGTHFLVLDALRQLPADFGCWVVETEFWRPMASPNLMVEIAPRELGDLITALTFHVGEVKRNPYHLALPAWMGDNVRRGSELIGGQGAAAPDFKFATLYRVSEWSAGNLSAPSGGRFLSSGEEPAKIFRR